MRKLTSCPIIIREAKAFVRQYHRHNKAPQGAIFAIGASFDGELVGVVMVGRPVEKESGASLRGAGFQVEQLLPPNKNGWNVPSRPRDFQPVYGQAKIRWSSSL